MMLSLQRSSRTTRSKAVWSVLGGSIHEGWGRLFSFPDANLAGRSHGKASLGSPAMLAGSFFAANAKLAALAIHIACVQRLVNGSLQRRDHHFFKPRVLPDPIAIARRGVRKLNPSWQQRCIAKYRGRKRSKLIPQVISKGIAPHIYREAPFGHQAKKSRVP